MYVCMYVRMYVCVWMYVCIYVCLYVCMYVWINRVRLPILLVVSGTGKMNISLSPFAPENLISPDEFGIPVPHQPAHLHVKAESGACLRDSSRVPRRRPFIYVVTCKCLFSFFNLTYGLWTSSLSSCLWSQRIFPSLPGSRLTIFYRDASSALLQLVNQWLNFTYSRSHAFRYERKNTNPTLIRIELTTSALAGVQITY